MHCVSRLGHDENIITLRTPLRVTVDNGLIKKGVESVLAVAVFVTCVAKLAPK